VAVDEQWCRIKVKSASYVALHHLGGNHDRGGSSALDDRGRHRSLVQIARNNEGDEFLAYYPQLEKEFREVVGKLGALERLVDGGGGGNESETQGLIQRFFKKMRQDGLSAKQVLQQAKIQDLEAALDLVPVDMSVAPSWTSHGLGLASSGPDPAITSEMPNACVKNPAGDPEANEADEFDSSLDVTGTKGKNRFHALLMEESSESDGDAA